MSVAAATVSYNGGQATARLLDELAAVEGLAEIILVENGSCEFAGWDLGGEGIRRTHLLQTQNRGFGDGVNHAAAHAYRQGHEYLWVVNSDCSVSPEGFAGLVSQAYEWSAAVASPMIRRRSEPQSIWFGGGQFDRLRWRVVHVADGSLSGGRSRSHSVSFVTGCAPLIRLRDFQEVGGFDPGFFMYWEDVDLCLKLSRLGKTLLYCPSSVVLHDVSGSSGHSGERSRLYYRLDTRNRFRTLRRHGTGLERCAGLMYTPFYLLRNIGRILLNEEHDRTGKLIAVGRSTLDAVQEGYSGRRRRSIDG
jgi:N-acetylglucosaminyl-diphospho-decaprenol L-rhamnosyltransferase